MPDQMAKKKSQSGHEEGKRLTKQPKVKISRIVPHKRYSKYQKKKGRVDEMIHKNNMNRRFGVS